MAAEGQSDKMVSDMEACTKQRCGIEFLHVDKIACFWPQRPNSISSVRWWVVHFSSDGSNMKDKPCSEQPCTAVTVTWRVSLPAHPRELDYNLGLCTELSICFSVLEPMAAVLEYHKGHDGSHICSQRSKKNTSCKFVRTYWTIQAWRQQLHGLHHYLWWDVVSPLQAGAKTAICGVVMCEFPMEDVPDTALSVWSDVHCLLGQWSGNPSGFPGT